MRFFPLIAGFLSAMVLVVASVVAVYFPLPKLSTFPVQVLDVVGTVVETEAVNVSTVSVMLMIVAAGGMTVVFFIQIMQPSPTRSRPSRRRVRRELGSEEGP